MTTDQTALVAHIAAINAKTRAWIAEDPTKRGAGILTEDAEHWAEYGIFTVAQFEHYEAKMTFWDFYKSVHGIRPRWMNLDAMTLEELQEGIEGLSREAAYEREQEERERERVRQERIERKALRRKHAKQFNKGFTLAAAWPE